MHRVFTLRHPAIPRPNASDWEPWCTPPISYLGWTYFWGLKKKGAYIYADLFSIERPPNLLVFYSCQSHEIMGILYQERTPRWQPSSVSLLCLISANDIYRHGVSVGWAEQATYMRMQDSIRYLSTRIFGAVEDETGKTSKTASIHP